MTTLYLNPGDFFLSRSTPGMCCLKKECDKKTILFWWNVSLTVCHHYTRKTICFWIFLTPIIVYNIIYGKKFHTNTQYRKTMVYSQFLIQAVTCTRILNVRKALDQEVKVSWFFMGFVLRVKTGFYVFEGFSLRVCNYIFFSDRNRFKNFK